MPGRSDAKYFRGRAEVSRAAAARSDVRGAIFVHRQMAAEYDRLSKTAEANDAAAAAAAGLKPDADDQHNPSPAMLQRWDNEGGRPRASASIKEAG